MSDGGGPALSVVLVTDVFATIRATVGHLSAQEGARRIELVVVHPGGTALDVPEADTTVLWGVREIEVPSIDTLAEARAVGVTASTAPVVAFGESHCYPQPGWAEGLLRAHARGVAAVGPAMTNANPGSAIAWANLLIDYGPWVEADRAGPRDDLPGHNSSYRRELLLGYGAGLGARLECEFTMHADLRSRGHVLWLEPGVRASHLNVTRPGSWLPERFWAGRQFAAARARRWPPHRRLVFAAASPLLPAVRAWRTVPAWRRCSRSARLPLRVAPALAIGLIASAAGELAGCLAGEGDSARRIAEIELHRESYVV